MPIPRDVTTSWNFHPDSESISCPRCGSDSFLLRREDEGDLQATCAGCGEGQPLDLR